MSKSERYNFFVLTVCPEKDIQPCPGLVRVRVLRLALYWRIKNPDTRGRRITYPPRQASRALAKLKILIMNP